MASTFEFQSHINVYGGINQGLPSHIISDGQFVDMRDWVIREDGLEQTPIIQKLNQFIFTGSLNKNLTGLLTFGQQPYYIGMSVDRAALIDPINQTNNRAINIFNKSVTLPDLTSDEPKAQCLVTGFENLASSITTVEVVWADGDSTFDVKINGVPIGGAFTPAETGTEITGAGTGLTVFFKSIATHTEDRSWLYTKGSSFNYPTINGDTGTKWKYVVAGNVLYAINGNYLIRARNETQNKIVFQTAGFANVKARYAALFYDHLVLGQFQMPDEADAPDSNRLRVAWSHISDLDAFAPTLENEADDYLISLGEAFQGSILGHSITGLANLKDKCVIYTPTGLYEMNYVGLPKVMVIIQRNFSEGNVYHDAVIDAEGLLHLFIGHDDFYSYDGTGVSSIGNNIARKFFDEVAQSNTGDESNVYGYYDKRTKEAIWVYKTTTGVMKELRYSIRIQAWTSRDLPDIFTTFDDKYTTISRNSPIGYLLYGGADGFLYKDLLPNDTLIMAQVVKMPSPMLETRDNYYDAIEKMKDTDGVFLDSIWDNGESVKVEYCSRNFLTSPIVFQAAVTNWRPTLEGRKLSPVRFASGISRFRFTWLPDTNGVMRGARCLGYGEFVRVPYNMQNKPEAEK